MSNTSSLTVLKKQTVENDDRVVYLLEGDDGSFFSLKVYPDQFTLEIGSVLKNKHITKWVNEDNKQIHFDRNLVCLSREDAEERFQDLLSV